MPELSNVSKRFILHWGEMGTRWGISRTVAQVHALLYLSPKPLPADEIAQTLSVARSNVSTSIRELESWGIVRPVHVLGDRREHYESLKDVFELFRIIVEERKKREIDPTNRMLQECIAELDKNESGGEYTRKKLDEMSEFFNGVTGLYDELRQVPSSGLRTVVRMRGKLRKLLAAAKG